MSSRAHDRSKQDAGSQSLPAPNSGVQSSGAVSSGVQSALAMGQSTIVFPGPRPRRSAPENVPLPPGAVQLRTISFLIHRDFNILIHDTQDPDQSEWDQSLAAVEPLLRANTLKGVLVRSFGGGPTPHQRRQVIDLYQGKQLPVANVSDSAVTRAITTAMSWFYRGSMRSYSPRDLPKAVSYLGIQEAHHGEFIDHIFALCANRGQNAL